MDSGTEAAIRRLAEWITRERKVTRKGEIAGAYLDICSDLHEIATYRGTADRYKIDELRADVRNADREIERYRKFVEHWRDAFGRVTDAGEAANLLGDFIAGSRDLLDS